MKPSLKNTRAMVPILAVLLAIALSSFAHKRRVTAYFTQSNLPGQCLVSASMPETCTTEEGGQICQTVSGTVTKTWWQFAGCMIPLYRKQ